MGVVLHFYCATEEQKYHNNHISWGKKSKDKSKSWEKQQRGLLAWPQFKPTEEHWSSQGVTRTWEKEHVILRVCYKHKRLLHLCDGFYGPILSNENFQLRWLWHSGLVNAEWSFAVGPVLCPGGRSPAGLNSIQRCWKHPQLWRPKVSLEWGMGQNSGREHGERGMDVRKNFFIIHAQIIWEEDTGRVALR